MVLEAAQFLMTVVKDFATITRHWWDPFDRWNGCGKNLHPLWEDASLVGFDLWVRSASQVRTVDFR